MSNDALKALTRFGLGPMPDQIRAIADDPRGYVLEQLAVPRVAPIPNVADLKQGLAKRALYLSPELRAKGREDERRAVQMQIQAMQREARFAYLTRLVTVRDSLGDRLALFWANHLVAAFGGPQAILAGPFENDVIRAYTLGRFEDMLIASTAHPGMLRYLDVDNSFGPNSRRGKRRSRGLNENFGRELLELHTLGAGSGYNQDDVIAAAKIMTGWTIYNVRHPERPGEFTFEDAMHEPGPQIVLGKRYGQDGVEQGLALLADLARHPATARHLSLKLVRSFVSAEPPEPLVKQLSDRFLETEGDLREVTRTLVTSDEAWTDERTVFLPAIDFVVATARALPGVEKPQRLANAIKRLGQEIWQPPSPAGFPAENAYWLGPEGLQRRLGLVSFFAEQSDTGNDIGAYATRLFGDGLSAETRQAVARAESKEQGLALLLMSPDFQRR